MSNAQASVHTQEKKERHFAHLRVEDAVAGLAVRVPLEPSPLERRPRMKPPRDELLPACAEEEAPAPPALVLLLPERPKKRDDDTDRLVDGARAAADDDPDDDEEEDEPRSRDAEDEDVGFGGGSPAGERGVAGDVPRTDRSPDDRPPPSVDDALLLPLPLRDRCLHS